MDEYDKQMIKGTSAVIGGIVLVFVLLMLPLNRLGVRSKINRFNASVETVEVARESGGIENAALAHKIVEANRWLKNVQYWNAVWWADPYIPDEVDNLEPIK